MLGEMIPPEAWLQLIIDSLAHAQAAKPRLRRIGFLFISFPVALSGISLSAFSCALVYLIGVMSKKLCILCGSATFLSSTCRWASSSCCCVLVACDLWEGEILCGVIQKRILLLAEACLGLVGGVMASHALLQ